MPALEQLKLVFELELRGRGDIQLFRVELPGPKVTSDIASDAKVRFSVPRSHFNELAADGTVPPLARGLRVRPRVAVTGRREILQLIADVVAKQEQRTRTRKLRARYARGPDAVLLAARGRGDARLTTFTANLDGCSRTTGLRSRRDPVDQLDPLLGLEHRGYLPRGLGVRAVDRPEADVDVVAWSPMANVLSAPVERHQGDDLVAASSSPGGSAGAGS